MLSMKLSPAGINKLCQLEAIKLNAYQDSVGVWTIGIGSTYMNGRPVKKGDTLPDIQAAKLLLMQTVVKYEQAVDKAITADISMDQFDALVIFCYNIGIGSFSKSTCVKFINEEMGKADIISAWEEWDKGTVNGQRVVLDGLNHRREMELAIYFDNNYNHILGQAL